MPRRSRLTAGSRTGWRFRFPASGPAFSGCGPHRLSAAFLENMLGIDAENAGPEIKRQKADALKEMVNIITGNSLTELFGASRVFKLGIPAKADAACMASDCSRADAIRLMAGNDRVLCVVDLERV